MFTFMKMFFVPVITTMLITSQPHVETHQEVHHDSRGENSVEETKEAKITISQGDIVLFQDEVDNKGAASVCSVGYVFEEMHGFLTSGHCATKGVGSVVMNKNGDTIGTVIHTQYTEDSPIEQRQDAAFVRLDSSVSLKDNDLSTQDFVPLEDVRVGDQLCSYSPLGDTTHCGRVEDVKGHMIISDRDSRNDMFSSGSSAWIPGKGFVGVYSLQDNDHAYFYSPSDFLAEYEKIFIRDRIVSIG